MTDPGPAPPSAMVLLRGGAARVARWLAKGVTPAVVAGMPGGWTLVTPAGAVSLAACPYDDAADTLLARRVPTTCRPALGVRLLDARLLVCVVERSLRAPVRWLAWEPGTGLVRPAELPVAGTARLARAAGQGGQHSVAALRAVLRPRHSEPRDVAVEMLDVLGLPGAGVLRGGHPPLEEPDARQVRPQRRFVAAFERAVGEGSGAPTEVDLR